MTTMASQSAALVSFGVIPPKRSTLAEANKRRPAALLPKPLCHPVHTLPGGGPRPRFPLQKPTLFLGQHNRHTALGPFPLDTLPSGQRSH